MQPRFLGRLALADLVSVTNAVLGFFAVAVAPIDPSLSARLILLAAIADGLDGVVARSLGSSSVGVYLDSLADVASFGVAPATLVYVVAMDGLDVGTWSFETGIVFLILGLFVGMAVVRLGFYMRYDSEEPQTVGVQTTLSAVLLAVAYLAGITDPLVLLGGVAVFSYLMVAPITYPELYARDAIVLGGLQAIAAIAPTTLNRLFPRALLAFALAYLVFAPYLYWRET
ncbi:MAG: protein sorting system archaetidylserine synthase [Natronomonas sp.]